MSTPNARTILLVGGGQGIGLETTLWILAHQPTVKLFVFGLHIDQVLHSKSIGEYASRLFILQGDVTSGADREKAIQLCLREGHQIDSLVYCAGLMGPIQKIEDVDLDAMRSAYEVNVIGAVAICKLAIPYLRRSARPRIVILSSACDTGVTYHGWMTYCTSKAALSRFVQVLAHENPTVRVQGVYPRLTDTKMPQDIVAGKYRGIMADDEIALFQSRVRDGVSFEPAEWCAMAVGVLAAGVETGGESGNVLYYDEHVPSLMEVRRARQRRQSRL